METSHVGLLPLHTESPPSSSPLFSSSFFSSSFSSQNKQVFRCISATFSLCPVPLSHIPPSVPLVRRWRWRSGYCWSWSQQLGGSVLSLHSRRMVSSTPHVIFLLRTFAFLICFFSPIVWDRKLWIFCLGETLLEVKTHLNDTQQALSDWRSSDSTPCNWIGIDCDPHDLRVTSMWESSRCFSSLVWVRFCEVLTSPTLFVTMLEFCPTDNLLELYIRALGSSPDFRDCKWYVYALFFLCICIFRCKKISNACFLLHSGHYMGTVCTAQFLQRLEA